MLEPGTYTAEVMSHAISETKAGNPQVVVTLLVEDGTTAGTKVWWHGQFSEKAAPYTVKNLITLGLKGNNPGGPIEIGKKVEIVTELNEFNGKTSPKVKYINSLNQVKNVLSPDIAQSKLSALEGLVLKARMESGQDVLAEEKLPF